MKRAFILVLLVAAVRLSAAPATAPAAPLTDGAMTVLRENCYSCHDAEKHKGGLMLVSRQAALKGGDDGPAFLPGDAKHSALIAALAPEADPHMPPKKELPQEDVARLRDWIDAGGQWNEKILLANDGHQAPATRPVTLKALPRAYHPAMALALSPDQHWLAVGRADRVVLYDLTKKGRPIAQEYATPHDLVQSLTWSEDSSLLASGGFRAVRVWDLKASQPVKVFDGLTGRITSLAFTPDAKVLFAGEGEPAFPGVIRSWQMADEKALPAWTAHEDAVFSMKVANGGKLLITGGGDKLVKMWELPGGKELGKFEGHTAQVMAVALSPDGKSLASGGADREIKIWDLKSRDQTTVMLSNPAGVTDLQWVDDKTILSACEDGVARYTLLANPDGVAKAFSGAPEVLSATVLAKNGFVYGSCHDGNVYVWAAESAKLEGTLPLAEHADETATIDPSKKVSFVSDVMPVLSRAGCNAGACHAKPHGQAGFKLSVFAFDPKSDYRAIVKEARSRRVFPAAPEESLLLKKPTMAVAHGGGKRLDVGSEAYRLLVRWIDQGMPYSREGEPSLVAVAVQPKQKRYAKGAVQPLRIVATYSDGSTRDVTGLAEFKSNDKELARVGEDGIVHVGTTPGEGVIVARFMGLVDVARITVPSDRQLPESAYAALQVNNFIDPLVHDRLKSLAILPSETCTDAEFLRRASIDVIGALPTTEQTSEFLADRSADKRERLVDRLLADSRYGDVWASKWCDLLRPNPYRAGIKSVYIFDQWLRDRFRRNEPYDQFAREILLAQGSTHRDGPVVIYRDRREPADITTLFSQIFLGTRLECAKCHHHPNEKWSQDDFYQLAAFFGPLKRKGQGISAPISGEAEFVWFAPGGAVRQPVSGEVMQPRVLDAPAKTIDPNRDPREVLADWMTNPSNPFFAKAAVNRVWAELMGRGIVSPVDDMRASNPPTNEPLLDALAKDFVAHHYDLKQFMRTILLSRAYQRSSIPNETNVRDTKNFSRWYRRRPTGEVLLDIVTQVTGVREKLPGLAMGDRAVQTWNNRLDSEFLDAFGRPNPSADPPCERDREGSIVQALHLMNSTKLMAKISDPTGRAAVLARGPWSMQGIVNELYLGIFCRYPTPEELQIAREAFNEKGATRQTATEDLMWAMMNSAEFVLNH